MTQRHASCSCGELTATTSSEPVRISICHCLACQRRTGSAFDEQARFRSSDVVVEGRARTRIDGVGASDCSCPGHLFYLGTSTIHDPLIRAAADQLHGRFVPVGEFTVRCSPD